MTATRNKSILVVEDEPTIAEICRVVLASEGFKVQIAANGSVAGDMIEKKEYDLCLIDIRMPAMNGVGLYQWLEEKHPEMGRRIAFITGDTMRSTTQDFLEEAKRPFLPKPFTPDQLKAFVNELLLG